MVKRREDCSGIVTRQFPEDIVSTTLFGTQELTVQQCLSCNQLKYKFEFYLESEQRKKYPDQTRKHCVVCWDKFNGLPASKKRVRSRRNKNYDNVKGILEYA